MSKKLLQIALLTILSFSFITAGGWDVKKSGGYARLASLGNNPYVIDPFNMTLNPAFGAVYDNVIIGDLGATGVNTDQWALVNFRVMDNLTIGGMLTQNGFNGGSIATLDPLTQINTAFGVVGILNSIGGAYNATALNNNIELMSTLDLNDFILGFGVAYASTSNETPAGATQTSEASASQFGLNAGVLIRFMSTLRLEGAFSLVFPGASSTAAGANEISVSETILGVTARVFYDASKKVTLIPAVAFISGTGSVTNDNAVAPNPNSVDLPSFTAFSLGLGMQYNAGDLMLVGGPALVTTSVTNPASPNAGGVPETSVSQTSFPVWNIGAEWDFTDWLTGRLGYTATTTKQTSEAAVPVAGGYAITETKTTNFGGLNGGPTGATLGLGLKFGGFWLDGTVNAEILRKGIANIGGNTNTFGYLSVGYAFN